MPSYAATATLHLPASVWLVAAVLALAWAAGYALSCWWWPFAACWRCKGAGRFARGDGKVWRHCGRCSGTGRRLRVGRWVYNAIQDRRRGAA